MNKDKISEDMTIKEVIDTYPETAMVFMKYNVGCIGCLAASFEKVKDIATVHGIDIKALVKDLNLAVQKIISWSSVDSDHPALFYSFIFERIFTGLLVFVLFGFFKFSEEHAQDVRIIARYFPTAVSNSVDFHRWHFTKLLRKSRDDGRTGWGD